MRWRRSTAAVLLAGLSAGLAGCQPAAPEPSETPSKPTPSSTQPAPPAPTATAQPGAGMPAGDGAAMLWPTTSIRTVYFDGWSTERVQYGFVDTRGELVVPSGYDWYEYCRDQAGRATLVLAGTADQVDVLDLSGEVVRQIPGRTASCIGDTHAEFARDTSDAGPAYLGTGLFDLRSGEVVIKPRKGHTVTMLDRRTVNVHQAKGEYFLDVLTGTKTPHPGYLTNYVDPLADPADRTVLPASDVYFDSYQEPKREPRMGYIDRQGNWALKPALERTDAFHAGHAVVTEGGRYHFIDTTFRRVGRDWDWIDDFGQGYTVGLGSGETVSTGVLGLDQRVLLEPLAGDVYCDPDACRVLPRSGPPKLLLLPEGTLADLPAGFSTALSRTLFSDATPDTPATRILNTETGTTFPLSHPGECEPRGRWLNCTPAQAGAPPAVYGSNGEPTVFRDIVPVDGAVADTPSGYYWATAGSQQGFVDDTGTWLYQESRYTTLED